MKLGYCIQGSADVAFIKGLARRYSLDITLEEPHFRGESKTRRRQEMKKAFLELVVAKHCHYVVILTDADTSDWRDVLRNEWDWVPQEYQHLTVLGVTDRNVECWFALDRAALAGELGCEEREIPADNPSNFIKRRFGVSGRDKEPGLARIEQFVSSANLRIWIKNSLSFANFYDRIRELSKQPECTCDIPNEREAGNR